MRPLTILHTESSTAWGGQEIRIFRESLGMVKRGHRVIIAAPPESMINRRSREAGIHVHDAEFSKKNPFCLLRIKKIIEAEGVDVVNTHSSKDSWISSIAAKISGKCPLIVRTRHLSVPIGNSVLSRFLYDHLPHAVITTGEAIRQRMITHNGFRESKIVSIPTGIDLNVFDPERVEPSISTRGFMVGSVSVLRSWKGHEYLVRAIPCILKEVSDAYFYIIGDGPQYANILAQIKELGLEERVLMFGHREDIPQVIQSLDVVVHPSYANEGVPQSILQALAMRKPVIASDSGAIGEVVRDGKTGFLIPPKDVCAISEKVIALYKNPALGHKFAEEGRKVAEDYSFDRMLDKIEGLYARFL